MKDKSILLLSDDDAFTRACAKLGVDLTVVIGSNQRDWGEVVIDNGTRQVFAEDRSFNLESVLLRLYRAGLAPLRFDAVYASDELAVTTAAVLAGALEATHRSLTPHLAALFRDKSLQKDALRAAGVRTTDYTVIEDLSDLPADYRLPFAPAVLKPVAGGATEHTSVIRTDADLQAAAQGLREEHWGRRRMRTFVLERFVEGEEWHVDGVVFDGRLKFLGVGGYRDTCLATVSAHRPLGMFLFDPTADAPVYERVTPFVERCLRTLGLGSGVFHLELFHDPATGELTFSECAARRGGGLIEEEIRYKFGVSLAEAAVHCVLGVEPPIHQDVRPGVIGTTFLPYVTGTLVTNPTVDDLLALPDVRHAAIELPAGYQMRPGVDTTLKIGQVMLHTDTREALYRRFDEVVDWFIERVVVIPSDASPAQLRAWQARNPLRPAAGQLVGALTVR